MTIKLRKATRPHLSRVQFHSSLNMTLNVLRSYLRERSIGPGEAERILLAAYSDVTPSQATRLCAALSYLGLLEQTTEVRVVTAEMALRSFLFTQSSANRVGKTPLPLGLLELAALVDRLIADARRPSESQVEESSTIKKLLVKIAKQETKIAELEDELRQRDAAATTVSDQALANDRSGSPGLKKILERYSDL